MSATCKQCKQVYSRGTGDICPNCGYDPRPNRDVEERLDRIERKLDALLVNMAQGRDN